MSDTKLKPIIFNTEDIHAILDGRKTVTRRIAKSIYSDAFCKEENDFNHEFIRDDFAGFPYTGFVCRKCGYGVSFPHSRYPVGTSFIRPPYQTGDILYVRETWCEKPNEIGGGYFYKADAYNSDLYKWRPSIHMPKEAARIFLRVTNVRVEKLQDITMDKVRKEGVKDPYDYQSTEWYDKRPELLSNYEKAAFAGLWDTTIKKSDLDRYGWNANPWVWVIEFERINKEEVK